MYVRLPTFDLCASLREDRSVQGQAFVVTARGVGASPMKQVIKSTQFLQDDIRVPSSMLRGRTVIGQLQRTSFLATRSLYGDRD